MATPGGPPLTGSMRRGEYRNFTFRFPSHRPRVTITLTLTSPTGALCLFASNTSERPHSAATCQWAVLVNHTSTRQSTLTIRTQEFHFIRGMYHVGLYCFNPGSFSLTCAEAPNVAPRAGSASGVARSRSLPAHVRLSPRRPPRRNYGDASVLEEAISRRRRAYGVPDAPLAGRPRAPSPPRGEGDDEVQSSEDAAASSPAPPQPPPTGWIGDDGDASLFVKPGERHHRLVCGGWHDTLRDTLEKREAIYASRRPRGLGFTVPPPSRPAFTGAAPNVPSPTVRRAGSHGALGAPPAPGVRGGDDASPRRPGTTGRRVRPSSAAPTMSPRSARPSTAATRVGGHGRWGG